LLPENGFGQNMLLGARLRKISLQSQGIWLNAVYRKRLGDKGQLRCNPQKRPLRHYFKRGRVKQESTKRVLFHHNQAGP
jgi:hypothetical protein